MRDVFAIASRLGARGFFNHKCSEPSCRCRAEWYDGRPVLVFGTIGVLEPHTVLTWNYNGARVNGYWLCARELNVCASFWEVEPCRCGDDGVCPLGRGRVTLAERCRAAGGARRRSKRAPSPPPAPLKSGGGRIKQEAAASSASSSSAALVPIKFEDRKVKAEGRRAAMPSSGQAAPVWPFNLSAGQRANMRRIVREAEQAVAARAAKTVRDMKRKAPGWEYMRPAKKQAVNVSSDVIHDPLPGGRQRSAQEARDAVRMRLEQVLGDRFSLVEQGRTNYFTIANRQVLSGHPAVRALPTRIREAILKDDSKRTPLERGSSTVLVGMSSGSRAGFLSISSRPSTSRFWSRQHWPAAQGTATSWEFGRRLASSCRMGSFATCCL